MIREELRQLLNWMMVSDPWPEGVNRQVVENLFNEESTKHGFKDWIDAYHRLEEVKETPVSNAAKQGFFTLFTDTARS